MDTLLDLLSEYYPKALGNLILKYYYNGNKTIYDIFEKGAIALIDIGELKKYQLNYGIEGACRGGHIKIVKLMIEKGADSNMGLRSACEDGHMEIVKLMIEKGADDFSWGLGGACWGGNMEIAKLMIEKGATKCNCCNNTKHPELLP